MGASGDLSTCGALAYFNYMSQLSKVWRPSPVTVVQGMESLNQIISRISEASLLEDGGEPNAPLHTKRCPIAAMDTAHTLDGTRGRPWQRTTQHGRSSTLNDLGMPVRPLRINPSRRRCSPGRL